jgi:hypothetical protein
MLSRKEYTFARNGKIYRAIPDEVGYHVEEFAGDIATNALTEDHG